MDIPDTLQKFFSSGHVVDVALAFIALEFVFLSFKPKNGTWFSRITSLLHVLGPGVCLMFALRCALVGAESVWIAFWLATSLPLHIWDVTSRRF
jgi:hypothetical protein